MLGVIGAVLGIVTSLAQLGGVSAASIAVDVVIYAVILWYLWQPSIQRAFGRNVRLPAATEGSRLSRLPSYMPKARRAARPSRRGRLPGGSGFSPQDTL